MEPELIGSIFEPDTEANDDQAVAGDTDQEDIGRLYVH